MPMVRKALFLKAELTGEVRLREVGYVRYGCGAKSATKGGGDCTVADSTALSAKPLITYVEEHELHHE